MGDIFVKALLSMPASFCQALILDHLVHKHPCPELSRRAACPPPLTKSAVNPATGRIEAGNHFAQGAIGGVTGFLETFFER